MSGGCDLFWRRRFQEQDAILPHGARIHYAVGPDSGPPLLLIHGQTGCWAGLRSRAVPTEPPLAGVRSGLLRTRPIQPRSLPLQPAGQRRRSALAYPGGHRPSRRRSPATPPADFWQPMWPLGASRWYWEPFWRIPPVFSTEPDFFPRSFAFQDTYAPLHRYLLEHPAECWEAYYLRHCLWGRLFLPKGTAEKLARYAQRFRAAPAAGGARAFFSPRRYQRYLPLSPPI